MFTSVLFIIETFENNPKSSINISLKTLNNNYIKSIWTCVGICKSICEIMLNKAEHKDIYVHIYMYVCIYIYTHAHICIHYY